MVHEWSWHVLLESCPTVLDEKGVNRLLTGLEDSRPYVSSYVWKLLALGVWARNQRLSWK